ncbi:hypothetical protein RYX36_019192 [Vicia faba]
MQTAHPPSSRRFRQLRFAPPMTTPSGSNKLSSPNRGKGKGVQSIRQRRLTRQKKLRYPTDLDGEPFEGVSFSLPASPLRSSGDHRSCSAVPLPLPSPFTRWTDHHAIKTVDHEAARTPRSSSNLGRSFFATVTENGKNDLRVNIPPVRSLVTSNNSCKDTRKHSHDNECGGVTNGKLQFAARSAPTSVFPSPVTGPRRLSKY